MSSLLEKLSKGIEMIVPADGLAEKLKEAETENRPLIVKLGMDPTAPDLHLGHAVVLKKIREFQEAGHEIHLIVGDFTAQIGDPTGRNTTRPPLTAEEVKINAQTYIDQLHKVVGDERLTIHFNNDWLGKMTFSDVIKLLSRATLAQMMQREDFNNRYTNNIPIALHELLYPMLQGYDSVEINSDIEFGGRDQLFNNLVGKSLQESFGKKNGQVVLCMPLLRGLDGVMKMSKSKNNYIGLTEPANDMYGKTMSIPDDLLEEWIQLTTDFDDETKVNMIADLKNGKTNPMDIKKKVAFNIVKQYHDEKAAQEAEAFFYKQVQQKGFDSKTFEPVCIQSLQIGSDGTPKLLDVCFALNPKESKSALRRLIESGAVCINGDKVTDCNQSCCLVPGTKIKMGKRHFFELTEK